MATDSKTALEAPMPRVILGTMTYGGQTPPADAEVQLDTLIAEHSGESRGVWEIDTARMYQHGHTEEIVGDILAGREDLKSKLVVATKVNPFKGYNETLTPESVKAQMAACLAALKLPSVDILYLHAPDIDTPIERTLAAVNELYRAGQFRELGLSNYPAWEVAHIHHMSRANGWVVPTVYQGMYNAITRAVEVELFPCLAALGMRFYAYNPLAGGMLTGKHKSMEADDTAAGTRFDPSNKMYRDRFWRPSVFKALDTISAACDAAGITMTQASLRWMTRHSGLRGGVGDGVIIGASRQDHLTANLAAVNTVADLPEDVVAAFDDAWAQTRPDCPKYFRP